MFFMWLNWLSHLRQAMGLHLLMLLNRRSHLLALECLMEPGDSQWDEVGLLSQIRVSTWYGPFIYCILYVRCIDVEIGLGLNVLAMTGVVTLWVLWFQLAHEVAIWVIHAIFWMFSILFCIFTYILKIFACVETKTSGWFIWLCWVGALIIDSITWIN